MKRCANCNDFALYEDSQSLCPVCGGRLETYVRSNQPPQTPSFQMPVANNPVQNNRNDVPQFEVRRGNTYTFRGRVTDVSSQSRSYSRFRQICNALFRGEPYQFGSTTYSRGGATCYRTRIRIEEFVNDRLATEKREVVFFGDAEGRLSYGDDVTVTAKRRGDRYIVKSLYCNDTQTPIRAESQIPPVGVWIILLLIISFIAFVIGGIGELYASGFFTELFSRIALPLGLAGYGIYRFRRRRRFRI